MNIKIKHRVAMHIPSILNPQSSILNNIDKSSSNYLSTRFGSESKQPTHYSRHQLGHEAEQAACEYLIQQGLTVREKNYACRFGEIDLIMQEDRGIVFVEVRARTDQDFYDSLESITRYKQQKIIKSAIFYLQENKLLDRIRCRFDVVAIKKSCEQLGFYWIQHAFD